MGTDALNRYSLVDLVVFRFTFRGQVFINRLLALLQHVMNALSFVKQIISDLWIHHLITFTREFLLLRDQSHHFVCGPLLNKIEPTILILYSDVFNFLQRRTTNMTL